MTDVLIRNVPEEDLRRIDAKAARLGMSRTDYLRRQITDDARRAFPDRPLTADDFTKFDDLADDELMRQAWS